MNDWITPDWPAPPNVKALFTTRNGGVSHAPYASLNLGAHVGDDTGAVEQNRAALKTVRIGRQNTLDAEVVDGLAEGETVIIHPSEGVVDGTRVIAR